MKLFKDKYRIKSARLENWDYSTPWWYYVTICTKNMKSYFGSIKNGEMILNDFGNAVKDIIEKTNLHYTNIELEDYIIMPNHIHIIIIVNPVVVETGHAPSLRCKPTLGNVIGSIKSAVSKFAHEKGINSFSWQSRFYDHIIRNEKDLFRIREYIRNNPLRWELDEHYRSA